MKPLFSEDEVRLETRFWTYLWIVLGLAVVTILYFTYLQYALGFATRPARLNNAQRQEAMSARMNGAWEGLQASQLNADRARTKVAEYEQLYGADASQWPQGKRAEYLQDKAHLDNAVAAYNRSCGEYNAVYADEFRAIAAPKDLPARCALIGL